MKTKDKKKETSYLSIWTKREVLDEERTLHTVYGINDQNRTSILHKYVEVPAALLSVGDSIADTFDKNGRITHTYKVKEKEVIDKMTGSCRGIHINKQECFDRISRVKVVL